MSTHLNVSDLPQMASSDAKNGFSSLLERVQHGSEPVVITRNSRPTAVMLSIESYQQMLDAVPDPLASLASEFDEMVSRMQTPTARSAIDQLFDATPQELGAAAVRGVRAGR